MSSARKIGRNINRSQTERQIHSAAAQIDLLSKQVPALLPYMNQLRTALETAFAEQSMIKYEECRMRAVQMRFMLRGLEDVIHHRDLIHETDSSRKEEKLSGLILDLEEQYRAEYDVLVALARLAEFALIAQAPQERALQPTG